MDLNKILSMDLVSVNLSGNTKETVIENLLDMLMKTGKVRDRGEALECIMDRENKMSTGIENGVAIPHGKTSAVSEMIACVGIINKGMNFKALDGKPSRLFILTLSPASQSGPHIQFLSYISSLLKDAKTRERIISAGTDQELLQLLTE